MACLRFFWQLLPKKNALSNFLKWAAWGECDFTRTPRFQSRRSAAPAEFFEREAQFYGWHVLLICASRERIPLGQRSHDPDFHDFKSGVRV